MELGPLDRLGILARDLRASDERSRSTEPGHGRTGRHRPEADGLRVTLSKEAFDIARDAPASVETTNRTIGQAAAHEPGTAHTIRNRRAFSVYETLAAPEMSSRTEHRTEATSERPKKGSVFRARA